MRNSQRLSWLCSLLLAVAAVALVTQTRAQGDPPRQAQPQAGPGSAQEPQFRDTRLFRIEPRAKRIIGPAKHVPDFLDLRLASVTMDQPQYWPNEKVRVKVVVPARPAAKVTVSCQKRDATPRQVGPQPLDDNGLAVIELADGSKQRLELGEYRVEVRTADKELWGSTTFAVVEGNLGALSLAHEFRQVTNVQELEQAKGAWFLGNAAGAGRRWGNGLSFKNELRVNNRPFEGEVLLVSRCMLPGCNGIDAGPRQKLQVKGGLIAATLSVSSHSGPFQVELVTPQGSLRHQFEGSSHVERDMVAVSRGVRYVHRVGLAPYTDTTQVPGRQLFVERKLEGESDAFEVESIVAQGGSLTVRARRPMAGAALHVWVPRKQGGKFDHQTIAIPSRLAAGAELRAPVAQPFALVAVGGFVEGKLVEGYTVAFPPSGLKVGIELPAQGAPLRTVPVTVSVTGEAGQPVSTSGILEAFDNRVAVKSPTSPLASAIGDSVRRVSNSLSSWVDPLDVKARLAADEPSEVKAQPSVPAPPRPPSLRPASGAAYSRMASPKTITLGSVAIRGRAAAAGAAGAGSVRELAGEAETEPPRQGEQKVVFCERVQTDQQGRATVAVKLPPQTGRVAFRFAAVKGLDHGSGQKDLDVSKRAYLEARLPGIFVPGASLQVRVLAVNSGQQALTLRASGAGIEGTPSASVPPGQKEVSFPWKGASAGTVTVTLSDGQGKVVDRRELAVRDVSNQPVTYSRLEFASGRPIRLQAGETAVVYRGPGELLSGIVMNMVTTMYSWFGHAEALSAQVAVRATLLAAIHGGLLSDDGLEATLRVDLDKAVRDLGEKFFDAQTGLVRPYPGLPLNPLWSAWVGRNLHSAVRSLRSVPALAGKLARALGSCEKMASSIDHTLKLSGHKASELGGYDPTQDGLEVIPVEVGGKVVYKVLTDDAVQRFAIDRLLPALRLDEKNSELAFSRAYDKFRFLSAFRRTGALQYLTEAAKALWLASGKRPEARQPFHSLFATISRGMIFTQEPGMIQGPALLGGVYSTPMAMVRYLELLLLVGKGSQLVPAGAPLSLTSASSGTAGQAFGKPIVARESLAIAAPAGAVVRIDFAGKVSLSEPTPGPAFAQATVSKHELRVAEEAGLTIQLDASRDPLEYYALVAVPTTTAIKQTEDILSDYKGQLIYGQQGTGGTKMQVIAVPFRGHRTINLLLEGLYPGSSPGLVAIRHLENPQQVSTLRLGEVRVRE